MKLLILFLCALPCFAQLEPFQVISLDTLTLKQRGFVCARLSEDSTKAICLGRNDIYAMLVNDSTWVFILDIEYYRNSEMLQHENPPEQGNSFEMARKRFLTAPDTKKK